MNPPANALLRQAAQHLQQSDHDAAWPLLLSPSGKGQLWYWTEINGHIPWYPSIEAFRQNKVGDWGFALQSLQQRLTSSLR